MEDENIHLHRIVNSDRDNHKILETLKNEMNVENTSLNVRDIKQERLKVMWIMNNKYKVKMGKQKDLAGLIASLVVDIQKEKEETSKSLREFKDREKRASI